MFWLKACPRCKGDVYEGWDIYGSYIACLQCARGFTKPDEAELRRREPPSEMLVVSGPGAKLQQEGNHTQKTQNRGTGSHGLGNQHASPRSTNSSMRG